MSYKLLLLSSFLWLTACTSSPETGTWETVTATDQSVPVERHEAAFVAVDNRFYLLGGRGVRPVSIFDTKTQRWTKGSPPPFEIHHFQPIVYQNKIYLIGAMTGAYPTEKPVANIVIYHPAKDRWQIGAAIPPSRRRGAAGAVLYQDKIYLACGIKNGHLGDHKNWLDSYDFKTGEWTILPDAPRTRDHFQAVVAEDKLYLLAGRNTKAPDESFTHTIAEVDVFDLKTLKWSTLKNNLPTLRAGNAALLYQEEILVLGGESGTQVPAHNEVEALDIDTHTWRSLSPLLQGRHGTSAVIFDTHIYLASGCGNRGGEPELQTMERFKY